MAGLIERSFWIVWTHDWLSRFGFVLKFPDKTIGAQGALLSWEPFVNFFKELVGPGRAFHWFDPAK